MNKSLDEIVLNLNNKLDIIDSEFKKIMKNKYKLFFNNFKENINRSGIPELMAQVEFLQFIAKYHKVNIKNLETFIQDINKYILEISIYNKLKR